MIAEMIKDTGWKLDYILSMQARSFFALKKEFNKLDFEDRASKNAELCDIVYISNSSLEYYKDLKDYYRGLAYPEAKQKRINFREFDADNEDDNKYVGNLLAGTFKTQKRLLGYG